MGTNTSSFLQNLRKYSDCKVEVVKFGATNEILILDLDDMVDEILNKNMHGDVNIYVRT